MPSTLPALRLAARLELAVMGAATAGVLLGGIDAYRDSLQPGAGIIAGVHAGGADLSGMPAALARLALQRAGAEHLESPFTVRAGDRAVTTDRRTLGATVDVDSALAPALRWGRTGDPLADLRARLTSRAGVELPLSFGFDDDAGLTALEQLSGSLAHPPSPTRLDLDARSVVPARPGQGVLAAGGLSAVAVALADGASAVELPAYAVQVSHDPLGEVADDLDVSTVLGHFETPYKNTPDARDRVHNLVLGAAKLDGHVLMPGESFSFNDVVGPRDAESGFRYATGITAGELVDVLGGGICQISSTLYGAAFFAGLELQRSRPHSRPSSYVDMGLDSTVVYPDVDMRFVNDQQFPVVFHVTVNAGQVRAEILGKTRPYTVTFERTLHEVLPYRTVWRDDPTLQVGTTAVVQRGMRGFKIERVRKLETNGQVVDEQRWPLSYPPTTEIVRRGTSPNGEVPPKRTLPALRDPTSELRITQ